MVVNSSKGMYFVQKDVRNAFNQEAFESKYIEECFDRYQYIVGDISSSILRLKGFSDDKNSDNYIGKVSEYLETSCALGCPYFILKRLHNNQEYEMYSKKETETASTITVASMDKIAFNKDELVLESSPKTKPRIVLDINRINEMPKGYKSKDIEAFINEDTAQMQNNKKQNYKEQKEEVIENATTYVSSSSDFDPSKKKAFNHNRNKNKNRK